MSTRTDWHPDAGATVLPNGVRFRVWAPNAARVEVAIEGAHGPSFHPLTPEPDGWYAGMVPGIGAGARYRYRLDSAQAYPDPCARFQPDGVHGPSEVIDPRFAWTDEAWPGLGADGLVLYEIHVGTYTPEGTFAALRRQLPTLQRLGVTAIELMPVSAFPGRWNWGYDGVDLYAPSATYGRPDDLRRLVDAAHRLGLGVVLDVVYNHLGPDGNYLRAFSEDYFTDRYCTPWGEAINYDGPSSRCVREYVIQNACYWLAEYHLDGLRLDATHAIHDASPRHLLAELAERARAATPRRVVLIAEDGRNEIGLVRPAARGGYGLDAVWADDFHHELHVLLTGEREGYFEDYAGTTAGIARAINEGFVYQGQRSRHMGDSRGTPVTDEPARAFVFCIQNHDQVGNRALGDRLSRAISPARYAVASALLLFAPETPLLFMGQEFAASAPFQFFTDHHAELGKLVTEGRRAEFKHFRAFQDPALRERIPDPQAAATFVRSKLDLGDRAAHAGVRRLYQALLRLRRDGSVLCDQDRCRTRAVPLGEELLLVHRWRGDDHRVLLANFGPAVSLPLDETPVLADLPRDGWRLLLSTAWRRFGGNGQRAKLTGRGATRAVVVPAETGVVFAVAGDLRG